MATLQARPSACSARLASSSSGRVQRIGVQRSSRAVAVRAQAGPKLPAGVTAPPTQPDVPEPMTGFVYFAEKLNGRFAMIGFFALLAVEAISGKGFLELIGAEVGKGLGFEL